MGTFSSDLQNRIRTNLDRKIVADLELSSLSINRATIILNSIGSLSKMKGSAWTFKRSHSHEGTVSNPGSSSLSPSAVHFSSFIPSSTDQSYLSAASAPSTKSFQSTSRSRRKSAHTVLLEDDSSDESQSRGGEGQQNASNKLLKTLLKGHFTLNLCLVVFVGSDGLLLQFVKYLLIVGMYRTSYNSQGLWCSKQQHNWKTIQQHGSPRRAN